MDIDTPDWKVHEKTKGAARLGRVGRNGVYHGGGRRKAAAAKKAGTG